MQDLSPRPHFSKVGALTTRPGPSVTLDFLDFRGDLYPRFIKTKISYKRGLTVFYSEHRNCFSIMYLGRRHNVNRESWRGMQVHYSCEVHKLEYQVWFINKSSWWYCAKYGWIRFFSCSLLAAHTVSALAAHTVSALVQLLTQFLRSLLAQFLPSLLTEFLPSLLTEFLPSLLTEFPLSMLEQFLPSLLTQYTQYLARRHNVPQTRWQPKTSPPPLAFKIAQLQLSLQYDAQL
jgi:hypothetical protein